MMRRVIAVLMCCVLLTLSTKDALARPIQRRSTWDELSRMLPGMSIGMTLPDTTVIRGQALEVRPDELVVDVQRTSNARLHAKGRAAIPRLDVSTIELFFRRPPEPHLDATAIGAAAGGTAVSPLIFYLGETGKGSAWAHLAILIGGMVGGAMIAKLIHHTSSDLIIVVQ